MSDTANFLAIVRYEWFRTLRQRRLIGLSLLALMPVSIAFLYMTFNDHDSVTITTGAFAGFYQYLVQRHVVFFGCVWLFMSTYRGEMVDRTLHLVFLTPIRREVQGMGKFVGSLLVAIALFGGTTLFSFIMFYLPFGVGAMPMGNLLAYLGITALACLGYGAMFMLLGILFKNPAIPAVLIYAWEWAHFMLPALLKKLSVLHYLKALAPVPVAETGLFAIVADPVSAGVAVGGLLLFSTVLLAGATYMVRGMEIRYGLE